MRTIGHCYGRSNSHSDYTVQTALEDLEVGKPTGPDEISAKFLKETAPVIDPSLCKIFNKSLQLGSLPSDWRLVNVVPVHKKSVKDHVENYHPISLLPIVSKVMERYVLNGIKAHHLYQVISPLQHCFFTGRSFVTNLLEAFNYSGSLLGNGSQVDTIHLDMSKAFDRVRQRRLDHKLSLAGASWSIGSCPNRLSGRRQLVTALGATSKDLSGTSGVPQGSILGPALFLLYVNDLPDVVSSSRVLMSADDTKIFREIRTLGDASSLQIDLGRLKTWSQTSGLVFNEAKCKAQRITSKTKPIMSTYKLNNTLLGKYAAEKDLGVWITNDLTWSKHVHEKSARANKLLGYSKRITRFILGTAVRRTLFLGLVGFAPLCNN